MVFQFVFSVVTYTVAIASGVSGWVLLAQSAAGADNVEVLAALTYLSGLGGGELYISRGAYTFTAQVNVTWGNLNIRGAGKNTEITFAQSGFAFMFSGTIQDIVILDIKFIGDPTDDENQILGFNDVTYVTVERCHFEDVGDEAIVLQILSRHGFINNNTFVDCDAADALGSVINLQSGYHTVTNNDITGGLNAGILLEAIATAEAIARVIISKNRIIADGTLDNGIVLGANQFAVENAVVTENEIFGVLGEGIRDCTACAGAENVVAAIIVNNIVDGAGTAAGTRAAIRFDQNDPADIIISGNIVRNWDIANSSKFGIYCVGIGFVITCNIVDSIGDDGIKVSGTNGVIQGNLVKDAGQAGAGNRSGIDITGDDYLCVGNFLENCRVGIRIFAGATDNVVRNNKFTNITVSIIIDAGTNTQFETIPLYIVTYDTDSESEDGPIVDGVGEWVSFVGQLPLHVQAVVRFEIWAVGLAAPGAGNQMCLTIEIEGGADDEPKTQHDTGALAGQLSATEATAIDDIIHWVCTHANALALLGGDSVKCACRYNAAVASDIATNAAFRRVLAHIV